MNSNARTVAFLVLAAQQSVLIAYNVSPSTTFFNQALTVFLWGAAVVNGLGREYSSRGLNRQTAQLADCAALVASTVLVAGLLWHVMSGTKAWSICISSFGICAAAAMLLWVGRLSARAVTPTDFMGYFLAGWLCAGLLSSAVAFVQVFSTQWANGDWIAHSPVVGRAVGNLRQPNHLSSVLLWATIALVGWLELLDQSGTQRIASLNVSKHRITAAAWLCLALLVWAVVLTASRTGLVGLALLALWGLADRRLSRSSRLLLLATPVMYAIAWWGMAGWAQASEHTFGGQQRLAEGDISGSRFRIWADAVHLIVAHPWTGVGWGNFNFAWSLTPFPNRHTAFFDHTHNLPLQLAVELGVPMALLICGLLLWALWQGWKRALAAEPAASAAGRCAVMMVVLIGLHSLLEYPLWYAYFLLPTAFAWGFALGLPPASNGAPTGQPSEKQKAERQARSRAELGLMAPGPSALAGHPAPDADLRTATDPEPTGSAPRRPAHRNSWPLGAAGALCVAGAVFSVFDYLRVADIFAARPGAAPLEQRIEIGKHSVFFAHHAHYAAATVSDTPGQEMGSFDIASHHLLDTRLMMAWAKAFAEVGDLDRARHLAERLREFRNPASADFFAECDRAREAARPLAEWPFQCSPPSRALTWQDFLPQRLAAEAQAQAATAPAEVPRR